MKREKGFTLIELLTVVIILGIIGLVVTPIVSKVITQVRKSTFLDNVNELVKIMRAEQLTTGGSTAIVYSVENNNINPRVSFKKNFVGTGTIVVEADGNTSVSIQYSDKYCAYKALDDTEIIIFEGFCNEAASHMGDTKIVFDFKNTYQRWQVPKDGYYKVDAWGAQGGTHLTRQGGKGAYTSGVIYLKKDTVLYIYVGESPTTVKNAFNGGGKSGSSSTGNSGGGATDIRYFGNQEITQSDLLWDSELGLKSRIMVAGGGGGSSSVVTGSNGGYGGLLGEDGKLENTALSDITASTGGKTTLGGTAAVGTATALDGTFGKGGNATTSLGGGGGAGYYGGGGGSYSASNGSSGAGGSSYISGYAGVNSINSEGNHTNNTVHYSGLYFLNTQMSINNRRGNGSVMITYLDTTYGKKNTDLDKVRYVRDCINGNSVDNYNHWTEIEAIYNGINVAKGKPTTGTEDVLNGNEDWSYDFITDGRIDNITPTTGYGTTTVGNQCVTVDLGDEYNLSDVAVWHYWADGRNYNNKIISVSTDGTNFTTVLTPTTAETVNGHRVSAYQ